jgi:hypothetical protein
MTWIYFIRSIFYGKYPYCFMMNYYNRSDKDFTVLMVGRWRLKSSSHRSCWHKVPYEMSLAWKLLGDVRRRDLTLRISCEEIWKVVNLHECNYSLMQKSGMFKMRIMEREWSLKTISNCLKSRKFPHTHTHTTGFPRIIRICTENLT